MKAKDKLKQIALEVFGSSDGVSPKFPNTREQIQEAMEISFKAGIAKGKILERTKIGNMAEKAVEQGKKAGRSEVVEWVEEKRILANRQTAHWCMWQAKLKEWGIE